MQQQGWFYYRRKYRHRRWNEQVDGVPRRPWMEFFNLKESFIKIAKVPKKYTDKTYMTIISRHTLEQVLTTIIKLNWQIFFKK